ncbi:MAG: homoserine dehydrogenase [Planctomycetes bacterium]|nr:homoserine dehydrogenase [Planctomycetota bacterium]
MNKAVCRVGIVGAGTVGGGTIDILINRADLLESRGGVSIKLAKVADLNKEAVLAAGASEDMYVDDFRKITEDPDIDIVVELVGGMGIANDIVKSALENGKAVVTANKALLAEKGRPLFDIAKKNQIPLAFEAAVAGGIPIIIALREGLVASNIESLLGIMNGTCNYILTEMIDKGVPYESCLAEAQRLGYAEADPTFDVEGIDTGHKLALLSALAFGTWVDFPELKIQGITGIDLIDIHFAQTMGYTVKLLAVARPVPEEKKLFLSVHPALLSMEHPLANVLGSMNAVSLYGDVVKESMYYGRGAGREPTANAVVADIVQVARSLAGAASPAWTPDESNKYELADSNDYCTRYYLRFSLADRPGVLGLITTALGKHEVSIASMMQLELPDEEEGDDEAVTVVMVSHVAREGDILAALAEISEMDFMHGQPISLRIEE